MLKKYLTSLLTSVNGCSAILVYDTNKESNPIFRVGELTENETNASGAADGPSAPSRSCSCCPRQYRTANAALTRPGVIVSRIELKLTQQ